MDGNIEVLPYKLDGRMPCEYCDYIAVCGYDPSLPGYDVRKYDKLSEEEVWEEIERYEMDKRPTESN